LYLVVVKGKQKGTVIPVTGELFLIGTEPVCQLRVHHREVGGQHCAVVTRDDKVFVRDMDSGRPTLINDREMPSGAEWPIHARDRLTVGPLQVAVQLSETALSQRDAQEWASSFLDEVGKGRDKAGAGAGRPTGAAGAAAAVLGFMAE